MRDDGWHIDDVIIKRVGIFRTVFIKHPHLFAWLTALIILIAYTICSAQQWGFYRATEVVTSGETVSRELDYEYTVAQFDSESGTTKDVVVQVYKKVIEYWTNTEWIADEKSSQVQMMRGPKESPALFEKDLRECYESGHTEYVISRLMVLYLKDEVSIDSGQRIPCHIRLQAWLDAGEPGEKVWITQNYKISGTPMRDLTPEQIEELIK